MNLWKYMMANLKRLLIVVQLVMGRSHTKSHEQSVADSYLLKPRFIKKNI